MIHHTPAGTVQLQQSAIQCTKMVTKYLSKTGKKGLVMLSLFIFVFFSHVLVVVNSLNWALLGSGYGLMSTRLFSSPSSSISSQTRPPVRVVVTGAGAHSLTYSIVNSGDSVGYILFKKLLKRKQFYPIGLVRDNASYRKLIKEGKQFRTFLLSSYYLHTIP